jgi:hypothetical protein
MKTVTSKQCFNVFHKIFFSNEYLAETKKLFIFLRKEVIQPQVPLRLPCYDFTPVINPTVAACLLAVSTAS